MNIFRGLMSLLGASRSKPSDAGPTSAGEDMGEANSTLKSILSAIQQLKTSSPETKSSQPVPNLPKMSLPPQPKTNPPGETLQKPFSPDPMWFPEDAKSNRVRKTLKMPPIEHNPTPADSPTPPPKVMPPAPVNFTPPAGVPPTVVPPPPVNFTPPEQPAPQVTVNPAGNAAKQAGGEKQNASGVTEKITGFLTLFASILTEAVGGAQDILRAKGRKWGIVQEYSPEADAAAQAKIDEKAAQKRQRRQEAEAASAAKEMPPLEPVKPPTPVNHTPPPPVTFGESKPKFSPVPKSPKAPLIDPRMKPNDSIPTKPQSDDEESGSTSNLLGTLAKTKYATALFAGGLFAAGKKMLDFSFGINKANEGLRNYSGQLSVAFAELQIQDIHQKMSMAQNTEGSASALAGDIKNFKESTQPMKETFATMKNAFAGGVVKYFTKIADIADWGTTILGIHDAAQKIEDNTREDGDGTTIEQQAIRELASGRWRSEGQPGLFQGFDE